MEEEKCCRGEEVVSGPNSDDRKVYGNDARQLFNIYYNGHDDNFTDEELNELLDKITELEEQLKELKQAHYDETFKNGLPF